MKSSVVKITSNKFTYNVEGFILHFSSPYNISRFTGRILAVEAKTEQVVQVKFHLPIKVSKVISALILYLEIEKRGFYVENTNNGEVYNTVYEMHLTMGA